MPALKINVAISLSLTKMVYSSILFFKVQLYTCLLMKGNLIDRDAVDTWDTSDKVETVHHRISKLNPCIFSTPAALTKKSPRNSSGVYLRQCHPKRRFQSANF